MLAVCRFSCLASVKAPLKSLHRAAECIVLHQRLSGLLAYLLLLIQRIGSLVPEAMALTPQGSLGLRGREESSQSCYNTRDEAIRRQERV